MTKLALVVSTDAVTADAAGQRATRMSRGSVVGLSSHENASWVVACSNSVDSAPTKAFALLEGHSELSESTCHPGPGLGGVPPHCLPPVGTPKGADSPWCDHAGNGKQDDDRWWWRWGRMMAVGSSCDIDDGRRWCGAVVVVMMAMVSPTRMAGFVATDG